MKIACAIIQERNISINTPDIFSATYKGREINITTNHGHGKPKYNHLKRYDIIVTINGSYEVNTFEDLYNMYDAIRYALTGACLLNYKLKKE
jgi:hypothetical protein